MTVPPTPPPIPAALAPVLEAVRRAVAGTGRSAVYDSQVTPDMGCRPAFEELRALVALGHLAAAVWTNRSNGQPFLVWSPRAEPQPTYACDQATARRVIADVADAVRGDYPYALYSFVRERFVWFDRNGNDLFRGVAGQLVAEGVCRREVYHAQNGREYDRFDVAERFEAGPPPPLPVVPEPGPDPSDADFEVLNALEYEEAARIVFGGHETAVPPALLAGRLNRTEAAVRASLDTLAARHYLLPLDHGTIRSRMAELAGWCGTSSSGSGSGTRRTARS